MATHTTKPENDDAYLIEAASEAEIDERETPVSEDLLQGDLKNEFGPAADEVSADDDGQGEEADDSESYQTALLPSVSDLRKRLRSLLNVPESARSDELWDEIIELEIQLAPGNRVGVGGQANNGKSVRRKPGGAGLSAMRTPLNRVKKPSDKGRVGNRFKRKKSLVQRNKTVV